MRNLARNERRMWYALYTGKTEETDANGDYSGVPVLTYSKPVEFWAVLFPGRGYNAGFAGTMKVEIYGVAPDAERRIMTTDLSLPVTETSLIWVTEPKVLEDGTADPTSADYSVAAKPSDGKTFLAIPVKLRNKDASL